MLAALGDETVELDVEGERTWASKQSAREMARAEPTNVARLLPAFDPWVDAASRRSAALLEPGYKARIYRPQGWISPVVLVNGRMVGVWKHRHKGRRVLVEIEPFGKLPTWARPQLEAEAERLAEFLGRDLVLTGPGNERRGRR